MTGVLSHVVCVTVLLVGGCVGKALLAETADYDLLLPVRQQVALQVRHQTEGLAALGTTLAPHLGVRLQSESVGKRLQTQGAVVKMFGVGLLMVEEGTSVAVGAPTQVTPAVGT